MTDALDVDHVRKTAAGFYRDEHHYDDVLALCDEVERLRANFTSIGGQYSIAIDHLMAAERERSDGPPKLLI